MMLLSRRRCGDVYGKFPQIDHSRGLGLPLSRSMLGAPDWGRRAGRGDFNGMLEEFKKFAMRGNALDLAVGVVIGAAFGKIVSSLVDDLIMPVIGAITPGNLDFSNYYIALSSNIANHPAYVDAKKVGAAFGYGAFLTALLNFLIVAFALFLLIRGVNRLAATKAEEPAAPPAPPREEVLLEEIRDLLAKR
jgi:large conductance mechanosensitive channel